MLINNELAFALALAFQFCYCRASAYVGWCPVYNRAGVCPAAQGCSVLYRDNSKVSAGVFRSGMPFQGREEERRACIYLPVLSNQ